MNLEEELRAVLSQEAEMQTTPRPDIEGMLTGGQDRLRRRRNTMWIGLAAASVLLVGGGVYGASKIGDPDATRDFTNGPSQTPTSEASEPAAIPSSWQALHNTGPVDPGTYRTFVGNTDSGLLEADLTLDGSNWDSSNYPVAYDGESFAGIGVYVPDAVAGGCRMEEGFKKAATEPAALAQQLSAMPRSSVVQEPSATEAFGHNALHLRLRIDAWCDGPAYLVAEAIPGSRGISYFGATPEGSEKFVIIDFWVVDVNGTTVVVDMFHREDAPQELVEQANRARQSITFVTAE